MAEVKKYRCGVCQKSYENPEALRNEIGIKNGQWHLFKDDVCDTCAKKLGELVKQLGGELVVNQPVNAEAIQ